jgi:hypothetical protein
VHEKKNLARISTSMAVSLSEAWNEPPPSPSISAKRTHSMRYDEEIPTNVAEDEAMKKVEYYNKHLEDQFELLLYEFRQLRIEESRRCTVYLVIAGILFALLFIYIDRLQHQVKNIHNPRHFVGIPEPTYTSARVIPRW